MVTQCDLWLYDVQYLGISDLTTQINLNKINTLFGIVFILYLHHDKCIFFTYFNDGISSQHNEMRTFYYLNQLDSTQINGRQIFIFL